MSTVGGLTKYATVGIPVVVAAVLQNLAAVVTDLNSVDNEIKKHKQNPTDESAEGLDDLANDI